MYLKESCEEEREIFDNYYVIIRKGKSNLLDLLICFFFVLTLSENGRDGQENKIRRDQNFTQNYANTQVKT